MLTQLHGFPLWSPQPDPSLPAEYRETGVKIGDVGIITLDGGFDFLFNIWLPSDHPINPNNSPEDFDSFPRPDQNILKQARMVNTWESVSYGAYKSLTDSETG